VGILDKIFRRGKKKEVGGAVKYILKRRVASGGMTKVSELAEPTPIEELYESLTPGIYSLHKYQKGQTGFEPVWGPVEVLGDEQPGQEVTMAKRPSPFTGLREWADEMKGAQEDLKAAFEVLGPMAGYQKQGEGGGKSIVDQLHEAKEELKKLQEIFPSSTTKSQEIPVEGSIPAALVYAPTAIDQALDAVEKRLLRWGLVGEEEPGGVGGREVIKMPEKPRKAMEKKREAEDVKEEETKIEMPKKPGVVALNKPEKKGEIKVVEVGEEKVSEESEKNDKRTKGKRK